MKLVQIKEGCDEIFYYIVVDAFFGFNKAMDDRKTLESNLAKEWI